MKKEFKHIQESLQKADHLPVWIKNRIMMSHPEVRRQTAYHESGHFICQIRYCLYEHLDPGINLLALCPSNYPDAAGVCTFRPILKRESFRESVWKQNRMTIISEERLALLRRLNFTIKQLLGGIAAEYLYEFGSICTDQASAQDYIQKHGSTSDKIDSRRLAFELLQSPFRIAFDDFTEGDLIIKYFMDTTTDLFEYMELLHKVSKTLLKHSTIQGDKLKSLITEIKKELSFDVYMEAAFDQ